MIKYGTRRNGKTVLMQQAVNLLRNKGIEEGQIAFVTVQNNAIDGDKFMEYMRALLNLGVHYLFIDELTYVKESLDGIHLLSDTCQGKYVTLAATDSLMLWELDRDILYKRVALLYI